MEQNTQENLCEETSMAVLNSVGCSTGSQCNLLSTGVILLYRLVSDTILAALILDAL